MKTPVIASEAKQSISPLRDRMDCFVAPLPCANASRLSQAMTAVPLRHGCGRECAGSGGGGRNGFGGSRHAPALRPAMIQ